MPIALKDSETCKNLMRAFAGESQARNRYTFAAALARQQKLPVLAAVFSFTAGQEQEHAELFWNHLQELSGQTIAIDATYPVELTRDMAALLRSAAHNEYEESDTVYPGFAAVAREEGFSAVAATFAGIGPIEKTHGNRFTHLAEALETGTLFVSQASCAWMCLNCGHIFQGTEVPKSCPVCHHDQGFFVRLELSPPGWLF